MKASQRGDFTVEFDYDESRSLPVPGDMPLNSAISLLSNQTTGAMGINGSATASPSEVPTADQDLDREIQEAILHERPFWVGGAFEDAFQLNPHWDREQAEIRALSGDVDEHNDNHGGYSAAYDGQVIDPNLR